MVRQTAGGRPKTAPHPASPPLQPTPTPAPPPHSVQSLPGVSSSWLLESGKDGGWRSSKEEEDPLGWVLRGGVRQGYEGRSQPGKGREVGEIGTHCATKETEDVN